MNHDEIHYYPFIISNNKCDGGCATVENPFGRICVPNELVGVNLKSFDEIKWINESKTLAEHILCECKCEFHERKCNSRQK